MVHNLKFSHDVRQFDICTLYFSCRYQPHWGVFLESNVTMYQDDGQTSAMKTKARVDEVMLDPSLSGYRLFWRLDDEIDHCDFYNREVGLPSMGLSWCHGSGGVWAQAGQLARQVFRQGLTKTRADILGMQQQAATNRSLSSPEMQLRSSADNRQNRVAFDISMELDEPDSHAPTSGLSATDINFAPTLVWLGMNMKSVQQIFSPEPPEALKWCTCVPVVWH